jgi:deazaflavin-dependent oxidoreductase (nitroreductase family)
MIERVAIVIARLLLGIAALAVVLVIGLQIRFPLAQTAVMRLQRSFANPRQLRSAGTRGAYAAIIRHRGRKTDRMYETPVKVVRTHDGFVIALLFGPRAEWLKNVLATGSAVIVYEGHEYRVEQPEVVPLRTVAPLFAPDRARLRLFHADLALRVRTAQPDEPSPV